MPKNTNTQDTVPKIWKTYIIVFGILFYSAFVLLILSFVSLHAINRNYVAKNDDFILFTLVLVLVVCGIVTNILSVTNTVISPIILYRYKIEGSLSIFIKITLIINVAIVTLMVCGIFWSYISTHNKQPGLRYPYSSLKSDIR